MIKVVCLVPFAGTISMAKGEVREVSDEVADDLIQAGYVEKEKPPKAKKTKKGDAE